MLPLTNWLASALPVADAVSFEFDDINVTAQHVMTQDSASDQSDGRLLAFYDQFIKDYRGNVNPAHTFAKGRIVRPQGSEGRGHLVRLPLRPSHTSNSRLIWCPLQLQVCTCIDSRRQVSGNVADYR